MLDNNFHGEAVDVPARQITDYDDYVSECLTNGANNILSADQFEQSKKGLRFVNPGPAMLGFITQSMIKNSQIIADAAKNEGIKAAVNLTATTLKEEGFTAAKDFITRLATSTDNAAGGGKTPNSRLPLPNGASKGENNFLLGAYDVNPMTFDLKPGLMNRVYTANLNNPNTLMSYSHVTGFKFSIPGDEFVKSYFDNVIIPWLKNKAQASVGFRVDMSLLSSTNVINYLNALINGLSLLYFCTGLLSYYSVPTNKDKGTRALREMISAADIDQINQLKGLLSSVPIPPVLNRLIFWLYQSFTDGPNGQNILRFMPVGFDTTTDSVLAKVVGFTGENSIVIKNAIAAINTTTNMELSSMLTRIAPDWVNPTLYDPSPVPVYSLGWLTLFANAPYRYWAGTTNYIGSVVLDATANLKYISFDPNLDGLILGLFSCFVGTADNNVVRPGLGQLVSTTTAIGSSNFYSNRYSFVYNSSSDTYLWRPSNFTKESAFGRCELVRAYNTDNYYATLPNCIRIMGFDITSATEAAKDVLAYIMSIDTIKSSKSGKTWTDKMNKSKSKAKAKSQASDITSDTDA